MPRDGGLRNVAFGASDRATFARKQKRGHSPRQSRGGWCRCRSSAYCLAMSRNHIMRPFHLAFPVHDLAAAREFYGGLLGCREGRSADTWVDFDLYGHQLVAHLNHGMEIPDVHHNPVDGHDVPVPHFGVILEMAQWEELAKRLTSAGARFVIDPTVRFRGQVGEQATLFLKDPSGNALEFKAFADDADIFAS